MAGFYFRLELEDGTPAEPPVLHTAVPNWQAGDKIPLGADRMLRVARRVPAGRDEVVEKVFPFVPCKVEVERRMMSAQSSSKRGETPAERRALVGVARRLRQSS